LIQRHILEIWVGDDFVFLLWLVLLLSDVFLFVLTVVVMCFCDYNSIIYKYLSSRHCVNLHSTRRR